jgi:hypothetical protein
MPQVEGVESPNSCVAVEVNLDEIPSASGFDSVVLHLLVVKVTPFHVIFNLNEIMIVTCFNKTFHTTILHPRLKEFLEKCLAKFQVYIWFAAQHHNIYNYLDQIYTKHNSLYMLPRL